MRSERRSALPMNRSRTLRIVVSLVIVLGALYGLLVAGVYWAMTQPPERFGGVMKHVPGPLMAVLPFRPLWMSARAGDLEPGDPAPDFVLPLRDNSGEVRLSDFRGERPVVLIFGSYT